MSNTVTKDDTSTLFWHDNWRTSQAPKYIWLNECSMSEAYVGIVKDLIANFMATNMDLDPLIEEIHDRICSLVPEKTNSRIWKQSPEGKFSL